MLVRSSLEWPTGPRKVIALVLDFVGTCPIKDDKGLSHKRSI